jgi:hypothetical protein
MRKMMLLVVALTLCLLLPSLSGRGEEPKQDNDKTKVSQLMRKKLAHSQKVLEGITTQDYKMISANAEELIAISKETEWQVLKTPRFELHSSDFRRSAEDLIKAAKDKNVDAAALAYVDLTLTCVKCHKHVREIRD